MKTEEAREFGGSHRCPYSHRAEEISGPRYDDELHGWVLTRYVDVLAALRSSDLVPTSSNSAKSSELVDDGQRLKMDGPRLKMRAETQEVLSPQQLKIWAGQLLPIARERVRTLCVDRPVDLVAELASPMGLELAVMVTGVRREDAQALRALGEPVSDAAADPSDSALRAVAEKNNGLLRAYFPEGPEPLRDSGFVALSHTIPRLLANAWLALIEHPDAWRELHHHPDRVAQGVEELLRYAGLVRTLYRRAVEDVEVGGLKIRKGERLILRILAANHDPERFAVPEQIEIGYPQSGQLSLGAGGHACVAANLIRMAMVTITAPLLEGFAAAELAGEVPWKGGFGFRFPASLPARLRAGTDRVASSGG
jgi:cytochrome P450